MRLNRMWIGLLSLAFALCALAPAQAFPSPEYPSYGWKEFPEPQKWKLSESELFPQWQPGALGTVSSELSSSSSATSGRGLVAHWLTVEAGRDCYASILHYSREGQCMVAYSAQPLLEGQQVTLSIYLERGQREGLTRLIAWRAAPHHSWLKLLAENPNWTGEQVPGVYDQRWIASAAVPARVSTTVWNRPWLGSLLDPRVQSVPHAAAWPLLSASLDMAQQPLLKDCALEFDGISDSAAGAALRPAWRLDWGSDLSLSFELPEGLADEQTELWIAGELELETPVSFPTQGQHAVEVELNGWVLDIAEFDDPFSDDAQPFVAELSQYLKPGLNELRLRVSPIGNTKWLISGIDLWTK